MITKKSVMRNKNISNYGSLADYIVNEQTDGKIRNIAMWTSSDYDNDDLDLFIKEVALVQQANTLSNDDKTYHLIVSFRENELDINKLKQIEEDIAYGMGFEKHQRLCVVHNDTDNLHFHIAINKINPETNKIYTPYRDYQKLNDIAVAIENKYGLIKDNHIKSEIAYSKAQDIEKSGYMQSMQSYIQNIDMDNISSWQDFHKQLNEYGIMFLKRGAGAVFANGEQKIYVKASNVNRDYSLNKLEKRFGKYEPYNYDKNNTKEKYEKKPVNDNGLYNDYQIHNKKRQEYIKNNIEQINDKYDKKLDTDLYKIKSLLNKTLLTDASQLERMIINKTFNKMMKNRKEKIYKKRRLEKMKLYKDNPYLAFNNWVKKEALAGNSKARDFIEKQISKENYIIADFSEQVKEAIKVTKNGTFITAENKRYRNNCLNAVSYTNHRS
ncbi:MAG: relaxase/mobilization nuclease domain-containing protein, partial [Mucispirillum sp.]|nr:relaxase/mobilization nuclease domain-containing protein [Mucispirillum sp.]